MEDILSRMENLRQKLELEGEYVRANTVSLGIEAIKSERAVKAGLLVAANKLEEAEDFNANCDECGGEGVPEFCEKCFPLFDDARVMRRAAIAKATGDA